MNGNEFARYVRVSRGLSAEDASQDATSMSPVEAENLKNGVSTNWLDLILRDGVQQSHQLSASGGAKNTTYYLSGSFFDEKGILQKSDYRRYSFRANINMNCNQRLKVGCQRDGVDRSAKRHGERLIAYALGYSPLITPYTMQLVTFVPYPESQRRQYRRIRSWISAQSIHR
jgi:hypothetical protein